MRSKKKIFFNSLGGISKVYDRSLAVIKSLVGKRISVYDGKTFISLLIRDHHVGYRFGQFIKTKKMGGNIHNDTRKMKKTNKK